MIKESKYILRRILIGVGIVLVLGFLRSNKVYALSWSDSDMEEIVPTFKVRVSDTNSYKIYYNSTENRYYLYSTKAPNNYSLYIENASDYPYIVSNMGKDSFPFVGSNGWASGRVHFYNKVPYYLWPGDLTPTPSDTSTRYFVSDENEVIDKDFLVYNDSYNFSNNRTESSTFTKQTFSQWNNMSITRMWQLQKNSIIFSNFDMFNYVSHDLYYQKNINWSSVSKINSIQIDKEQDSGYVYRVYLIPHYIGFNPDLYSYEYKFGDNGVWEDGLLDGAGIPFTINGKVYFRVVDKSNNNVVDSATYTISEISKVYQGSSSSVDYNIDINATYNTLSVSNHINKVFLNVSFTPAYTSFIKYYYKFGSGDWVEIEEEEFNVNTWSYITNVNGTFYVKMEDLSGNILFDKTYEVNEIGKLGLMVNDSNMNNYFTSLSSKIGFGGPISSLINVPIRVLSVIGDSFSSGATCTNYSLGSLWGTHLVLPCVNIKQHLGNTLYTTIDLILSGVMIYTIFMWLCSMYDKFMNLDRDPAGDISRLGRW